MELHQIPHFNYDLRGQSLREQMIARIRQVDDGFHRLEELERMSDYALLCSFEISLTMAGHRSADSRGKDMFDAGIEYGKSKVNQ